ncbi:hypothetical protein Y032_0043g823 [Ancylostoma ceylanicum]|uniref:Uncharacterized protein n=1 Tax=Ancylostoma ceylanicum TaxID=53326 RepID=A0A016UGB3_9BILA|nr:hypothetical protein Y032_0043g823 [Ancylostoma ceylanicum]
MFATKRIGIKAVLLIYGYRSLGGGVCRLFRPGSFGARHVRPITIESWVYLDKKKLLERSLRMHFLRG